MTAPADTRSADSTLDGYAEARDLANRAVDSIRKADVQFIGSMMLRGGWELSSPEFLTEIGRALDEGRRAKDALHAILEAARAGLGI